MSTEQITSFLDRLSDSELVAAVATGKAILEGRFTEAARKLKAEQKRMLSEAVSGRKQRSKKQVVNVISKSA